MGKFCGMCGTPLEEGLIACPKCAHRVTQKSEKAECIAVVPEVQRTPEPVAIPEPAPVVESPVGQELPAESFTFDETQSEVEKSKKKKKALRITAVILAVLVVAGSVFGVWWLTRPKFISVGADTVAFSNRYGDFYYSGANLLNIDCVEDGPIELEFSPDYKSYAIYNPRYGAAVMVKGSLYVYTGYWDSSEAMEKGKPVDRSKMKYHYGIYKIDFKGGTEIESELWLTPEELSEYPEFDNGGENLYNLMFMQYSDGYIYFVTCEQKLARISMKDKEIEYIDEDIRTMNYVVDGKWIYFAGALEKDSEEVGIYKMKTDGSDMEMLYEFEDAFYVCEYAKLGVYKNKIYFIEFTEDEKTIYRMKKNGRKVEEIASGDIWAYTIDAKTDKLYYLEDERLKDRYPDGAQCENKVYEVSLKDFSSEHIFSVYNGVSRGTVISVHKGKLYFGSGFFITGIYESTDRKRDDGIDRIVGLYYDIKEEELNALRVFSDGEEREYYWDKIS